MPRRPNPKPKKRVAKNGRVTWFVPYTLDGVETSETFATNADALDFCADARDFGYRVAVNRLQQRIAGIAPSGPTVAAVFAEFAAWKRPRVRSSRTVEDYEAVYRLAIESTFGNRPIDSVSDADVQRWVDGMIAGRVAPKANGDPVGTKSIIGRHGLLHSVFAYAHAPARGYITTNPCVGTDLPKKRKGMPKGLRVGEWAALHAALGQVDPDAADLALALYSTGARWGEVTALQTFDIEDDGVTVTLNIGHVIRRVAGGKFERVEDTKSEAGFRRVTVDVDASIMFRRRVNAAPRGGLVFTNRAGRMWVPSTFRTSWAKAVELANLSRWPTPHWLRHTHVAEMLNAGAKLPDLQRRIGHESIQTTLDVYGRMDREVGTDVLATFAARRRAASGPAPVAGPVIVGEITAG